MNKLKKRTIIHLLVLTAAIAFIWIMPEISDTLNRIVMSWIAGWQIGDWAWQIADYLDDKYNE